ncbi:response regulator [Gallaecimonas kandeliae]|uniref:response regulator n=1 Tax=Gallaecimonas kandeliae TaxID=3029055 RepID=UPI002647957E|nr:response regulator [Gallaecimonas kandeliae]WKE65304.1 response regulator [Gallaecimonas kandeliae]
MTKVLICDDSAMARKQMARSLPKDWDIEILFAKDGREGLQLIRAQQPQLLFLDLNMPDVDGYQVLEFLRLAKMDLPVIVVSGDIQAEAHRRVMALGALAFIQKPMAAERLKEVLAATGLYHQGEVSAAREEPGLAVDIRDGYQEVVNVAMGRAGALLAQMLGIFVKLPIPKVDLLELSELRMALASANSSRVSAICQGFIGPGLAGEALLLLDDADMADLARLLRFEGELTESVQVELLSDIANVLVSACLAGLGEQLDVRFCQGHPVVLGLHRDIGELLAHGKPWQRILAVELSYGLEGYHLTFDLLLLLAESAIPTLNYKIAHLLE